MAKVFVIGQSFFTPQLAPNFPDGAPRRALLCWCVNCFEYSFNIHLRVTKIIVFLIHYNAIKRGGTIIYSQYQNGTLCPNKARKVLAQIASFRKRKTFRVFYLDSQLTILNKLECIMWQPVFALVDILGKQGFQKWDLIWIYFTELSACWNSAFTKSIFTKFGKVFLFCLNIHIDKYYIELYSYAKKIRYLFNGLHLDTLNCFYLNVISLVNMVSSL